MMDFYIICISVSAIVGLVNFGVLLHITDKLNEIIAKKGKSDGKL